MTRKKQYLTLALLSSVLIAFVVYYHFPKLAYLYYQMLEEGPYSVEELKERCPEFSKRGVKTDYFYREGILLSLRIEPIKRRLGLCLAEFNPQCRNRNPYTGRSRVELSFGFGNAEVVRIAASVNEYHASGFKKNVKSGSKYAVCTKHNPNTDRFYIEKLAHIVKLD